MRNEANLSSCMEVWNSKFGGNVYFDFEAKFGALPEVHFIHIIYLSNMRELGVQHFKQCANWIMKSLRLESIEFIINILFVINLI